MLLIKQTKLSLVSLLYSNIRGLSTSELIIIAYYPAYYDR